MGGIKAIINGGSDDAVMRFVMLLFIHILRWQIDGEIQSEQVSADDCVSQTSLFVHRSPPSRNLTFYSLPPFLCFVCKMVGTMQL